MKRVVAFITGNSRVTPLGVIVAVGLGWGLHSMLGGWSAAVYLGALVLTLAISTLESP